MKVMPVLLRVYLIRRSQIQLHQPDRNKPYNVGFSFQMNFIADYPHLLIWHEIRIEYQAIIPCEIYNLFLLHSYSKNSRKIMKTNG